MTENIDPYLEEETFYRSTRKEERLTKKIASKTDKSKNKFTDQKQLKKKRLLSKEEIKKKNFFLGRVTSISAKEIAVSYEKEYYVCNIKGSFHAQTQLAVGDKVYFTKIEDNKGIIHHVTERESILYRAISHQKNNEQIMAANIDQLFITISFSSPILDPQVIDRYLIAAQIGNMSPIIVINKIDLYDINNPAINSEINSYKELLSTYSNLNIPIISISAHSLQGMDKLKQLLIDKSSVFAGQSGVGKSSIINNISNSSFSTSEISHKNNKGTHTTSQTKLIELPSGGWCIDTPGVIHFNLAHINQELLKDYFVEINQHGKTCFFQNCTHTHEPECHVIKALEEGKIAKTRYQSYTQLLGEKKSS